VLDFARIGSADVVSASVPKATCVDIAIDDDTGRVSFQLPTYRSGSVRSLRSSGGEQLLSRRLVAVW